MASQSFASVCWLAAALCHGPSLVQSGSIDMGSLYQSMAGPDPASGKDWKSKPRQQLDAWNKSMQQTYNDHVPGPYQSFPKKATSIRASTHADDAHYNGYQKDYGSLGTLADSLNSEGQSSAGESEQANNAGNGHKHASANTHEDSKPAHPSTQSKAKSQESGRSEGGFNYDGYVKEYAGNGGGVSSHEKSDRASGSPFDYSGYLPQSHLDHSQPAAQADRSGTALRGARAFDYGGFERRFAPGRSGEDFSFGNAPFVLAGDSAKSAHASPTRISVLASAPLDGAGQRGLGWERVLLILLSTLFGSVVIYMGSLLHQQQSALTDEPYMVLD